MRYIIKKISLIKLLIIFLGLLLSIFIFQINPSFSDIKRPKPKQNIEGNKYMGAGTCASSNCHGAAAPRNREGIDINQNEFSIWFAKDAHKNAFNVLLNPKSERIAQNLRLPDPADESQKCLVCHTTYAPAALWGNDFDFSDGVSCESCHGSAEKWLGPHTQKDWNAEKANERGMYETKDLVSRADKCLSCHIGNKDKTVDHELIAAGHPDLNRFEFDTFLALMPPHWRKNEGNKWEGTEIWSVGQFAALKQSMEQLARRAGNKSWNPWPEFSEFNCYSCHHDLEDNNWRQAWGYSGRTPGFPAWNSARYVLIKPLAKKVSPELANDLDREVKKLKILLNRIGHGNPSQISSNASKVLTMISELQNRLEGLQIDQSLTYDLLIEISGDGNRIAKAGIRSAQQSAVALETLFYTYSKNVNGPNNQKIEKTLDELFSYLERPEIFTPKGFSTRTKKINRLLKSNN